MAAAAILKIKKSVAISLLLGQSSPNLMGMLKICHKTQVSNQKRTFTEVQDGGRRRLEFQKSVAIPLLLDQSSPSLVGMLKI